MKRRRAVFGTRYLPPLFSFPSDRETFHARVHSFLISFPVALICTDSCQFSTLPPPFLPLLPLLLLLLHHHHLLPPLLLLLMLLLLLLQSAKQPQEPL